VLWAVEADGAADCWHELARETWCTEHAIAKGALRACNTSHHVGWGELVQKRDGVVGEGKALLPLLEKHLNLHGASKEPARVKLDGLWLQHTL